MADKSVKIATLQAENVKRVKAVEVSPTPTGLTVIGGKNGEGKTSILDAIAWALGGNKYKPANATREGSVSPPQLKVTLSNGITVERKGKNSELTVTDPSGNKAGQALLDSLVEQLALNLPKFMQASSKDKAKTLLDIIGVGDKLDELQAAEKRLYDERTTVGRMRDQKQAAADEMPVFFDNVPEEEVSAHELIQQHESLLAKNAENLLIRQNADKIRQQLSAAETAIETLEARIADLAAQLAAKKEESEALTAQYGIAKKTVAELQDESTEEIQAAIANVETVNAKVRANAAKLAAQAEANAYREQYNDLTSQLDKVRDEQITLLNGADLPLSGLTVIDGELVYNSQPWENMSSSEQLRVAAAIVRRLNPDCGFVLMDKLEQMDTETLSDFAAWAETEGLQIIATRVSTGDECTIIIEDGYVVSDKTPAPAPLATFVPGEF